MKPQFHLWHQRISMGGKCITCQRTFTMKFQFQDSSALTGKGAKSRPASEIWLPLFQERGKPSDKREGKRCGFCRLNFWVSDSWFFTLQGKWTKAACLGMDCSMARLAITILGCIKSLVKQWEKRSTSKVDLSINCSSWWEKMVRTYTARCTPAPL